MLFADALNLALLKKYNKEPTAAFVSNMFNQKCPMGESITYETARNWLNGKTLPVFEKIVVLRDWLEIDLNVLGLLAVENIYPIQSCEELFPIAPHIERIKKRHDDDLDGLLDRIKKDIDETKKRFQ